MSRPIDANDHMYIENLAVDEKQCSPFCQLCFWGGVSLFVIHPKTFIRGSSTSGMKEAYPRYILYVFLLALELRFAWFLNIRV